MYHWSKMSGKLIGIPALNTDTTSNKYCIKMSKNVKKRQKTSKNAQKMTKNKQNLMVFARHGSNLLITFLNRTDRAILTADLEW